MKRTSTFGPGNSGDNIENSPHSASSVISNTRETHQCHDRHFIGMSSRDLTIQSIADVCVMLSVALVLAYCVLQIAADAADIY